jgi:type I restriction-modification system DNA methylase subunit
MAIDTKEKLGNRRVTGKEQYYTPRDVAEGILERVITSSQVNLSQPFLEPAAGTGSFMEVAK